MAFEDLWFSIGENYQESEPKTWLYLWCAPENSILVLNCITLYAKNMHPQVAYGKGPDTKLDEIL